jgi:hypothetical protein
MNAVEIEQAISELAAQPFDAQEFPFAFLRAFGNKETTLKRLRKGESNKSDIGGVLQTNNIHIAVAPRDEVTKTLQALRASPATAKGKAKFILATDGEAFEAEDVASGETVACAYADFPNHFGFFLPLAGITTVQQVRENAFDIRATSRLNRLYIELLKDNPDWGTAARRPDMNHFMARLIFCFFAEDTDIFNGEGLFTATIDQMSTRDSSNTHEVIAEIFRAMNTAIAQRANATLPRWADQFPYVNGGLFSGDLSVPRFSKIARSYLLHIGGLKWRLINPDIFGSMIQAVADDEERGALGLHYTSVPNILKVLNPLFLDDLRARLSEAGDNARALLNLRKRMSRIRVFDPACGSGNFLVIAYKQMREIEAAINKRRGESERRSDIPLTNFRGIELRDFPAEIARLALVIAEYQCDVLHRGQQEALRDFLPLDSENWITCGNALQLDWLSICPPTGTDVHHHAEDLFHAPHDQAQIEFANEGGETYICGNPPYVWSNDQTPSQKKDMADVFSAELRSWKTLNYVSAWFIKCANYMRSSRAECALVSTNTICQGQNNSLLWPVVFQKGCEIKFAHTSFKWKNLATKNAGVTVVIVGLHLVGKGEKKLFWVEADGTHGVKTVKNISSYLTDTDNVLVAKHTIPVSELPEMKFGNKPVDGGNLMFSRDEFIQADVPTSLKKSILRRIYGAAEIIDGIVRYCLWIPENSASQYVGYPEIRRRIEAVAELRKSSSDFGEKSTNHRPHQFREMRCGSNWTLALPSVSSENRDYLPATLLDSRSVISNRNYGIYDGPLWSLAVLVSRLHWVWADTVCGKLELRFSYTNSLGWNAFPIPMLTENNKSELSRCAEDILLAREAHFPATIADLYDPDAMPANLREAHARNDEVLERIYIGRRFRNDTERLEKLFDLYTKMVTSPGKAPKARKAGTV